MTTSMYPEWVTRYLAAGEPVTLLRVEDVAPMFRVAKSTVQTWVRQGRVRAIRTPGNEMRIPHTEIRRLMLEQKERDELTLGDGGDVS